MSSSTTISPLGTPDVAERDAAQADVTIPPYWLTGPCPDWCPSGEHHGEDHPDDRRHISEGRHITLSAEAADRTTDRVEGSVGAVVPAVLSVYLNQHYREIDPLVAVSHNESPSMYLTLSEAEELVQALLGLVQDAR